MCSGHKMHLIEFIFVMKIGFSLSKSIQDNNEDGLSFAEDPGSYTSYYNALLKTSESLFDIPDDQFLNHSEFSGRNLALATSTNLLYLEKSNQILKLTQEDDKKLFYSNLDFEHFGDDHWRILGYGIAGLWSHFSSWYKDFSSIVEDSILNNILIHIPDSGYKFCTSGQSEIQMCLDEEFFNETLIEKFVQNLKMIFSDQKLNDRRKGSLFQLWNWILGQRISVNNTMNIFPNVTKHFFKYLKKSDRNQVICQFKSNASPCSMNHTFQDEYPLIYLMSSITNEDGLNYTLLNDLEKRQSLSLLLTKDRENRGLKPLSLNEEKLESPAEIAKRISRICQIPRKHEIVKGTCQKYNHSLAELISMVFTPKTDGMTTLESILESKCLLEKIKDYENQKGNSNSDLNLIASAEMFLQRDFQFEEFDRPLTKQNILIDQLWGDCIRVAPKLSTLESLYGPLEYWTADSVESLQSLILNLRPHDLERIQLQELARGVENFLIRFSTDIGYNKTTAYLKACFGGNVFSSFKNLADKYLAAQEKHQKIIKEDEELQSNLRKRDVEGFCDFSDYNFIDYLFNYTSKIVWEKLDEAEDANLPHLGPILMDVRQSKKITLVSTLGLDPYLSSDQIQSIANEMFENNTIPYGLKIKALESLSSIIEVGIKRLILAGHLAPKDLKLVCQIHQVDLYKLFPNAVIEAHLKDFVREESSVQNVKNEDSKGFSCLGKCQLSVLLNGSRSNESALISLDGIRNLFSSIQTLYVRAITHVLTENSKDHQTIENLIESEKVIYEDRLRKIFNLKQISEEDLHSNISLILKQKPETQHVLDLELLSFHYSVLKEAVERLSVPHLAILKSLPDDLPVEIINDLFPSIIANAVEDYEQVFYKEQEHNEKKYSENNYQRTLEGLQETNITESRQIPSGYLKNEEALTLQYTVEALIDEALGNPVVNLFCSYRLVADSPNTERICPTDLLDRASALFEDQTNPSNVKLLKSHIRQVVQNETLLNDNGVSKLADQRIIQTIYLKILNYIKTNLTEFDLVQLLKLEGLSKMPYPDKFQMRIRRQDALQQMNEIAGTLVRTCRISPADLYPRISFASPSVQYIFVSHIQNVVRKYPKITRLMCKLEILSLGCDDIPVPYKSVLEADNLTKLVTLFHLLKGHIQLYPLQEGYQGIIDRMNDEKHVVCGMIAKAFDKTDLSPCSDFAIHFLNLNWDSQSTDVLERNLQDRLLTLCKKIVETFSIVPSTLGLKIFSDDSVIRDVFDDFLLGDIDFVHETIESIDPLYVRTKAILQEQASKNTLNLSQLEKLSEMENSILSFDQLWLYSTLGFQQCNLEDLGNFLKTTRQISIFTIRRMVQILNLSRDDFDQSLFRNLAPGSKDSLFYQENN